MTDRSGSFHQSACQTGLWGLQ